MAKVSMVLVFAADRPDGDVAERLDAWVRLTPDGQLDRAAHVAEGHPWAACWIRHDATTTAFEIVLLNAGWGLRRAQDEDGPVRPIDARLIRPGELLQLRCVDGSVRVFRIVNVDTA